MRCLFIINSLTLSVLITKLYNMKKVYLFSLSIFAAGVLNAQQAPTLDNMPALPASKALKTESNRPSQQNQNRAAGDIIWQDNFDDAALWTSSGIDANGNGWEIVNDATGWYYGGDGSKGLTGDFGALTCPSTDAALLPSGEQTLTFNNTIDLSTVPSPIFTFDQTGARFVTVQAVEVSINGGLNWTVIGTNNDHVPLTASAGAPYDEPENRQYTLASAIAVDPTNVTIRFKWDGAQNGPNMNYIDYGWFVDNVKIIEGYTDNIVHESLYLGDIIALYEYSRIPKVQGSILTVQSALGNLGSNTPSNLYADVTVVDASNATVFTGTGGTLSGPLGTGDQDTLTYTTTLDISTLAIGVYTVTSVIKSDATDQDLTNDTLVKSFEITDDIYSHFNRDAATLTPRNPGKPSNTDGDAYTEFEFGATFDIYSNQALQGINFFIAEVTENAANNTYNTTTDHDISIKVYEESTDPTQDPTTIGQFDYHMTDLDVNAWNTISLTNAFSSIPVNSGAINLEAGKQYRVTVACTDNGTLWGLGELTDSDNSSWRLRPAGWNVLTSELGIELNFDQTLSINDNNELNNLSVSQNVPNPFNGQTVVSYNLNEASTVSIQIMDVAGKVISTINEGTQAAGAHNITVDGSTLAVGTYFYTLTAGNYQVTKRMVVSK
jgi:hypothetical protein